MVVHPGVDEVCRNNGQNERPERRDVEHSRFFRWHKKLWPVPDCPDETQNQGSPEGRISSLKAGQGIAPPAKFFLHRTGSKHDREENKGQKGIETGCRKRRYHPVGGNAYFVGQEYQYGEKEEDDEPP